MGRIFTECSQKEIRFKNRTIFLPFSNFSTASTLCAGDEENRKQPRDSIHEIPTWGGQES